MEIGDNIAISIISERDEGIWSFVDSFWFALMTLTTVGYDLNPVTLLGKVFHIGLRYMQPWGIDTRFC